MSARLLAFTLHTLFAQAPSAPKAQPPSAKLSWARAPNAEGCPHQARLEAEIRTRLGYDPFRRREGIEIEGIATRERKNLRAELSFRDAEGRPLGKRAFDSQDETCAALAQAVAVAIAVAIDPDAPAERGRQLPPPLPTDPEESPWRSPSAPPPPSPPPTPPRGRAALSALGSVGLLPGVSTGFHLGAHSFLTRSLDAGVGVGYFPESRDADFGFGLAYGEAGACLAVSGKTVRICAGALAGAFETYVHTRTLVPREVGAFPWLGAHTGPTVSIPLASPLHLDVGARAIVPITRRQGLLAGNATPIFEQAPVAFALSFGLAIVR